MYEFIVYYQHEEFGYFSTKFEANSIEDAVMHFCGRYRYVEIYGIMRLM